MIWAADVEVVVSIVMCFCLLIFKLRTDLCQPYVSRNLGDERFFDFFQFSLLANLREILDEQNR